MTDTTKSVHGAWSSRFAFILAATGSAVGLGNIWKFPYITGEHGGGAFVLVYLLWRIANRYPYHDCRNHARQAQSTKSCRDHGIVDEEAARIKTGIIWVGWRYRRRVNLVVLQRYCWLGFGLHIQGFCGQFF